MTGKFVVLINGNLQEYNNVSDIPDSFDNLISFEPVYPPEPHTEEQHEEIAMFNSTLQMLMSRETK